MGFNLPLKHALRWGPLRASLAFLAATLGMGAWLAPSSAVSSGPAHAAPVAVAAKSRSFAVTASLHLVGRPGHVLIERGTVTGTLAGSAYSRNTTLPANRAESTFTVYAKGASVSGRSSSEGHVVGAMAYFSGTATITGGTGTWAHVTGSNLKFSGVVNRQNYNVTEHVAGTVHF
jgi:hypothetical protein